MRRCGGESTCHEQLPQSSAMTLASRTYCNDLVSAATLRPRPVGKLLGDIPVHVIPNGIQVQGAIASSVGHAVDQPELH